MGEIKNVDFRVSVDCHNFGVIEKLHSFFCLFDLHIQKESPDLHNARFGKVRQHKFWVWIILHENPIILSMMFILYQYNFYQWICFSMNDVIIIVTINIFLDIISYFYNIINDASFYYQYILLLLLLFINDIFYNFYQRCLYYNPYQC